MKALALLALAIALFVASSAGARTQANRVQIAATLIPSEETPVPKGDVGAARGEFTGTLTKSDSGAALTWRVSFTGLTGQAIASHIHIADRGKAGAVVVPFCSPCTSPVTGTANINPTVLEAIENDRAYVNVHTPTNPAGEIRGQISPVARVVAKLAAVQERPKPKGKTNRGRGTFSFTITKKGSSGVLVWRLTFSRLTGKAVAAHIHSGARGKAGPVIVSLCAPCKSGARGTATVDSSVLNALAAGGAYVNVHTVKNPLGEIRAQISAVALTIS